MHRAWGLGGASWGMAVLSNPPDVFTFQVELGQREEGHPERPQRAEVDPPGTDLSSSHEETFSSERCLGVGWGDVVSETTGGWQEHRVWDDRTQVRILMLPFMVCGVLGGSVSPPAKRKEKQWSERYCK